MVSTNLNESSNGGYARGYSKAFHDKKGSLAGSAIGILVLLTVLLLCTLLFATLQDQSSDKIVSLNDANATASFNHIAASGWSSIDLMGLIPYIAVFMLLLAMLMSVARD